MEPTSLRALSATLTAATTKGAVATSKEAAKMALYEGMDRVNVIPFCLGVHWTFGEGRRGPSG